MIQLVPSPSPGSPRAVWLDVMLWAAYLACSWTWCIGMFLPVLLVRDYGIMGWVVFAIPNVIGAAAMGWVLRDGMSERIVRDHPRAIETFRLVTVVFQLWFLLVYLAPPLGGQDLIGVQLERSVVIAAVLLGAVLGLKSRWSLFAWLISFGCVVIAVLRHEPTSAGVVEPPSSTALLWLAPVCAFGFALCPYLDPTFHLARQSMRASGARVAFSIGFGVLFLTMIAFTLLYAKWLLDVPLGGPGPGGLILSAVAVHIGLQLAYTSAVHARSRVGSGSWSASRVAFAMVLAGLAALAAAFLPSHAGLEAREGVYRAFMAFYGLIFPAYVWLCMIPFGAGLDGNDAPTARSSTSRSTVPSDRARRVFFVTIGLAAPFYWMGFIERQELWLAPGLSIVLIARLLIRPRPASAAVPAP